jgi:hypothetical protein
MTLVKTEDLLKKKFRTVLLFIGILCILLVPFYYYCKYKTVTWLHETNYHVEADSVYPVLEKNLRFSLKITKPIIRNKNPKSSVNKISADSLIIRPTLFSFAKLFSSYAFDFELKGLKINEPKELYAEITDSNGEVNYRSGIYHLKNVIVKPLKFKLTAEETTKKHASTHPLSFSIHTAHLNGSYAKETREFDIEINVPKSTTNKDKNENYVLNAKGHGVFLRFKLKEDKLLPINGNVKFNIDNFSNFLTHLKEAEFISGVADIVGSIIGYPVTKEKLTSSKIEEIMRNSVSLNLRLRPEGAHLGVIKIYP